MFSTFVKRGNIWEILFVRLVLFHTPNFEYLKRYILTFLFSLIQEKLVAEKTNSIEEVVKQGEYFNPEGKKFIILDDHEAQGKEQQIQEKEGVIEVKEQHINTLEEQLQQLQTENAAVQESLACRERQQLELNKQIKVNILTLTFIKNDGFYNTSDTKSSLKT